MKAEHGLELEIENERANGNWNPLKTLLGRYKKYHLTGSTLESLCLAEMTLYQLEEAFNAQSLKELNTLSTPTLEILRITKDSAVTTEVGHLNFAFDNATQTTISTTFKPDDLKVGLDYLQSALSRTENHKDKEDNRGFQFQVQILKARYKLAAGNYSELDLDLPTMSTSETTSPTDLTSASSINAHTKAGYKLIGLYLHGIKAELKGDHQTALVFYQAVANSTLFQKIPGAGSTTTLDKLHIIWLEKSLYSIAFIRLRLGETEAAVSVFQQYLRTLSPYYTANTLNIHTTHMTKKIAILHNLTYLLSTQYRPWQYVSPDPNLTWEQELLLLTEIYRSTVEQHILFPCAGSENAISLRMYKILILVYSLVGQDSPDLLKRLHTILLDSCYKTFNSPFILRALITCLLKLELIGDALFYINIYLDQEKVSKSDTHSTWSSETTYDTVNVCLTGSRIAARWLRAPRLMIRHAERAISILDADSSANTKDTALTLLRSKALMLLGNGYSLLSLETTDVVDRKQNSQQAEKTLLEAQQLDPDDWEIEYSLALHHLYQGNIIKAIVEGRSALQKNQKHPCIWHLLSLCASGQKKYEEALRIAELGLKALEDVQGVLLGEQILSLKMTHAQLTMQIYGSDAALALMTSLFFYFNKVFCPDKQGQELVEIPSMMLPRSDPSNAPVSPAKFQQSIIVTHSDGPNNIDPENTLNVSPRAQSPGGVERFRLNILKKQLPYITSRKRNYTSTSNLSASRVSLDVQSTLSTFKIKGLTRSSSKASRSSARTRSREPTHQSTISTISTTSTSGVMLRTLTAANNSCLEDDQQLSPEVQYSNMVLSRLWLFVCRMFRLSGKLSEAWNAWTEGSRLSVGPNSRSQGEGEVFSEVHKSQKLWLLAMQSLIEFKTKLGLLHLAESDSYEEAIQCFKTALLLFPTHKASQLELAKAYYHTGQIELAEPVLERLTENREGAESWMYLGLVYASKNKKKAMECMWFASELEKNEPIREPDVLLRWL